MQLLESANSIKTKPDIPVSIECSDKGLKTLSFLSTIFRFISVISLKKITAIWDCCWPHANSVALPLQSPHSTTHTAQSVTKFGHQKWIEEQSSSISSNAQCQSWRPKSSNLKGEISFDSQVTMTGLLYIKSTPVKCRMSVFMLKRHSVVLFERRSRDAQHQMEEENKLRSWVRSITHISTFKKYLRNLNMAFGNLRPIFINWIHSRWTFLRADKSIQGFCESLKSLKFNTSEF